MKEHLSNYIGSYLHNTQYTKFRKSTYNA